MGVLSSDQKITMAILSRESLRFVNFDQEGLMVTLSSGKIWQSTPACLPFVNHTTKDLQYYNSESGKIRIGNTTRFG